MRLPELNEPEAVEDMPLLVRRLFFVAAVMSLVLAALAAYMVWPGFEELLGLKNDGFQGQRDKALVYMAGLPVALCGIVAAVQGRGGKPEKLSRRLALAGLVANLAVLLGAGIPALLDYLKNN